MINTTRENFEITKERGFDILGVDGPNTRKATQMSQGDRLVFYVRDDREFVATATVSGKSFKDEARIWKHHTRRERYRSRVNIEPDVVASDQNRVDAYQVGPTLEYVRRWPPEMWDLAFFGMVHIISKRDFDLLEGELSRYEDYFEEDWEEEEFVDEENEGDDWEEEDDVEVVSANDPDG